MSQDQHAETGHILAIEPDPANRAALRRALGGGSLEAEVVIVASTDDALEAIARRLPDLILTSTFLTPRDEHRISQQLNRHGHTSHTQIITLPQFVEPAARSDEGSFAPGAAVIVPFRAKRNGPGQPQCDARTLIQLIRDYLDQAIGFRRAAADRQTRIREARDAGSGYVLPRDRRRAPRRTSSEWGGQWSLRLASRGGVRLVDMSRLGALFETRAKLTPGVIVDLHLAGIEQHLSIAARLVRVSPAAVNADDVAYHAAVAFPHEIDLLNSKAPYPRPSLHAPEVLGSLLGRVLAGTNWVSNGVELTARFEEELARLVPAQQVRLGGVSRRAPAGCKSVSFRIPGPANARLRLHVIFNPGHEPSPLELCLLRAAAHLASLVLDLAPSARLHSPSS